MSITQLIGYLQELLLREGNLMVYVSDRDTGEENPVTTVRASLTHPNTDKLPVQVRYARSDNKAVVVFSRTKINQAAV